MSKEHTIESATKLGRDIITASRTYGSLSGICQWASEDEARFPVLAAAIKVAVDYPSVKPADKDARKRALDTWTNTLKRIRKGEAPAKGSASPDLRPFLHFTREDGVVVVSWKTPEPKASKAKSTEAGEQEGEQVEQPKAGPITLEQAVARIQAALEDEHEAAQMRELFALAGIEFGIG